MKLPEILTKKITLEDLVTGCKSMGNIVYNFAERYRKKLLQYGLPLLLVTSLTYGTVSHLYNKKMKEFWEDKSPNIIFILIDALRADALGCYGAKGNPSPNIDKFAEEAVIFENYYAQSSWTVPQTATLMTGMNPLKHRMKSHSGVLSDKFVTLPEILKSSAYKTAVFIDFGIAPQTNLFQGADTFFQDSSIYKDVLSWIRKIDSKFFLYAHFMTIHEPYADGLWFANLKGIFDKRPAPVKGGDARLVKSCSDRVEDKKKYDHCNGYGILPGSFNQETLNYFRELYNLQLKRQDRFVKKIIEELGERHILNNSIVILLSDHGEAFYEHENLTHGDSMYNEILHSPLIIRFPHKQHKGRIKEYVTTMDITPSVLDYLKKIPQKDFDGISFIPLLLGQNSNRSYFISATLSPPWLNFKKDNETPQYAVFSTDGWKLLDYRCKVRVDKKCAGILELYNLLVDPKEQNNLYQHEPETANKLLAILESEIARYSGFAEPERFELSKEQEERLKAIGYLE